MLVHVWTRKESSFGHLPAFAVAPIAIPPARTQRIMIKIKKRGKMTQERKNENDLFDQSNHAKRTPRARAVKKIEHGMIKMRLCQEPTVMLPIVSAAHFV
jgi:hypothetical protein